MTDKAPIRLLSLAAILSLATANFVVAFFFGHNYIPSVDKFQLSRDSLVLTLMLLFFYVAAPLFIAIRVWTAPLGSAIFPIALVTSAATGFLLYIYIVINHGHESNVFLYLASLVLVFGAASSLIPKWPKHQ